MTNLKKPENGTVIDTNTRDQNRFIGALEEGRHKDAFDYLTWLKNMYYNIELTIPLPVRFEWESDEVNSVLEISADGTFEDAVVKSVCGNSCDVFNLLSGKRYYWRVNGGEPFVFSTSDNNYSFVKIDGAINVRDVGGIGIKKGLIYRGSELNGTYKITADGKCTICDELKIKTDLDLRAEWKGNMTESPAGGDVNLKQLPYRPYDEIFEEEHRRGICRIMEVFADEQNYPIYFHCMGGADRTGMIAYYLRARAGESDLEMHIDYELTSLCEYVPVTNFRSIERDFVVNWLSMLNEYAPGQPLKDKLVAFLLSCGVTENCIEKIRGIITA